jgi:hypothetical protein
MSETGSRLRATSDTLLADLERLEALERDKRQLEPDDPRLPELAAAVEDVARRLLGRSVDQRQLAAVAHRLASEGAPGAPTAPIEETPRESHVILADWRDAERRLADASPGTPEALAAEADIERYRDEYRDAHEAARRR